LRAVFDTNVLISAFVFPGGAPESAHRAALSGRVTLVTSPPLLAGLARVLADRFGWEEAMVETPVRQVARIGTVVRPADTLSMIEQDPNHESRPRAREAQPTSSCRETVASSGSGRGKGSGSSEALHFDDPWNAHICPHAEGAVSAGQRGVPNPLGLNHTERGRRVF
jgi:hypothetical protein